MYIKMDLSSATDTGKTVPDEVSRSSQYIGRSNTSWENYFTGDLDDFRLYGSALSTTDIAAIYAEASAGIYYQAQALNNPTGFSATGLPAGLSIDPTTGAITGHTTAVGDHNITLTASNLSGASPSKTITITVAAQKPLLTTVEFSPKNTQGVSLWLDASDANTISTGVSTNVSTWTNKIDPDVKMHGATAQPDTGGSINGLNAINFVGVANSYHEGMYARKNTSTAWSPAGTNGAPSGTYDDLIIAFVLKLNGNGFTSNFDTFNLGFGKHFFGANNQGIYWQYPTNNVANLYLNLGTSSNVLIFKHSVTENIRQVWLNGTSAGSTSASISAPTISGEFRFPCYDKSGGDYYNLTLGEMIVIKGTLTNNALQEIEGYLGSKWNLTDSLPNNHPYKSSSPIQPKIVTSAVGSNSATATATLLETGGTDTTLEVFYGTADKGETVIGWDSNSSLPDAQNPGDIALGMTGLSASTSYTYRVRASNSAGSVWSDAISFSTGAQLQPPAISASDASNVAGTAATTNGNLLSFDGSTQPTVTLYYDTEANTTSGRADPFIPFSLSNTLKIWMDAEDANSFQLSGSNITKWYNKAGNGYIFDQKTGDPSRTVVNGKNVVNFDGNDQLWTNDAFLASNYTVLSVSRLTGGQNARLITSKDNNWLIGYWSGRVDTFFFNGWLNRGGTYNADTNWHLHAVTMNNSDQGNTWVDFVQTTTNGNGADDTSYEPSKISFGANGNLSEASKGEIAELLVFDSVLPTSDRQKIEGYLAHKWGLTNSIPDVHPYKTSSPDSQVPATAVSLGQKPLGTFTGALNSLQAGTTYKYRFAATNPGGTAVSAVKTFTTLGLPKIEIPGATGITKTSATLNAKLTFTNGNDSNVTFYWGDNNGSNNGNHNQWDNPLASSTNQGVGVVGQSISGLTTGTTYYYTAKAVNAQGTAWGTVKTFVPANTAINKYSIPDLALWLDATDLDGNGAADSVANGSALPSWTDKSVTPKTVNQTSSTEQPVVISNAIGSKSVVRFDGNGDVLNVSSIRTAAGAYSIYAITQRISESGDTNGHLASEPTWALIPSATADSFSAQVAKNSASSGASLTNIKLGKSGSSTSNDYGGDLAELLIFSRQLSSSEEQKVEGYLAHKWGVANTLDSNHSYKDVPPIFNNKPLIRDLSEISNSSINNISGMEVWFDASDLDADGLTDSAVSGDITTWKDKSGNGYNASTTAGSPALSTNGGPGGGRVVQFRSGTANSTTGDEEMSISGSFTVRDHFYVVRSPSATWSDYGGIIGGGGSRHSNFIVERNQVYFHNNQYPSKVWKNGTSITSSNFSLSTINSYMILRIVVDGNNLGPHSNWKIGDDDWLEYGHGPGRSSLFLLRIIQCRCGFSRRIHGSQVGAYFRFTQWSQLQELHQLA